ncbi:UNVERIFIED_CONTAM: hypothetical protein Cloal_2176 [Acetivibrio alkalicellulosi]
MKKSIVVLSVAFTVLFSGCSDKFIEVQTPDKSPAPLMSVSENTEADASLESSHVPVQTPTSTIVIETEPSPLIMDDVSDKDYLFLGFELMKSESVGDLRIDATDEEIIKLIGEPENKSEAIEWGADGLEHQSWYYNSKGIEFDMVFYDDKTVVERIKIKSPCSYKTKRGIGVGSTKEQVLNSYKNEIDPVENIDTSSVIVGSIYGGIIFGIEDNAVSSIYIGAAAE